LKLLHCEKPLRAEGTHVLDATHRTRPVAVCWHPQNAQAFTALPDLLAGGKEMVANVAQLLRADTLLSLPTVVATAKLAAGIAKAMSLENLKELRRFETCGSLSGALRQEAIALILKVEQLLRDGGAL
jgi:hypothetical protein